MMCKAEKLSKDVFEDMPLSRRQDICLSLFHCLNWFRELVRASSSGPFQDFFFLGTGVCICPRDRSRHEGKDSYSSNQHH